MKINDVPQDQDPAFEGGKKICYAIGENGRFEAAQSSGWQVEAVVKEVAWNVIHADLERTRERVAAGLASPLEYFMKQRQMDTGLLAQNMGVMQWRVRRHLRPQIFLRLNARWVARYAECLDIEPARLREYKGIE